LKAFSAIFHPFPCLPGKEWGTDFRDLFQFVTELLGRLRLGGYAPEYVISALGALTAGHNPAGPIFWIILGIVLVVKANSKKVTDIEKNKKDNQE
jgi:hypothetical protein